MDIDSYILAQVKQIVTDCEEFQDSNESDYSKEQEKIIAYEKIAELMK